jgi:catechol 2,3-dioxygenase-like lactoylglutathione lyase family enzyme
VRLTHVRLLVDDFGAAYRFYTEVLGLEPAFGDETGPYASFATGEADLSIFERGLQAETADLDAAGDGALAILEVEDVDDIAERLGVGAPVDRPDWGLRVAYVRDPSGNLIELGTPIDFEEA